MKERISETGGCDSSLCSLSPRSPLRSRCEIGRCATLNYWSCFWGWKKRKEGWHLPKEWSHFKRTREASSPAYLLHVGTTWWDGSQGHGREQSWTEVLSLKLNQKFYFSLRWRGRGTPSATRVQLWRQVIGQIVSRPNLWSLQHW